MKMVGLRHIVLDGYQAPVPQEGGRAPNFRPISILAKRLDASRGLSPGDFVLDGDLVPSPKRGRSPPIFGPCLLWLNGLMDQDGTWRGGRPWSTPHCAKWVPSSPLPKRGQRPNFRPTSIVTKRLDASRGLSPGDFVLYGDPFPLPKKMVEPPNFRSMSTVAKRLHGSRCHLVRR